MISKIFAVIGANYGDEGKGMYVDHICNNCFPDKLLTVLCNGGAQRAHTVVYPKEPGFSEPGITHVYHHFGSGTLLGSPTYFTDGFILNPMMFNQEYGELAIKAILMNKTLPALYADKSCKISSPFDMILNQIQRENDKLNNSCGIGIWETINRYNTDTGVNLTLEQANNLINKAPENIEVILVELRNIFFNEIKSRGLEYSNTWAEIIDNDNLIKNYIWDLKFMINRLIIIDEENIKIHFDKYDMLLFEMGQGLLLDKDTEDISFSTSSNTGMYQINNTLPKFSPLLFASTVNLVVNYITRWCLTRHGSGPFESFDKNSEVYKYLEKHETTNKYNIHQGEFKFGPLDSEALSDRVRKDYGLLNSYESLKIPEFLKRNNSQLQLEMVNTTICSEMQVIITHMDEYDYLYNDQCLLDYYPHVENLNDEFTTKYGYGPMGKDIF